MQFAPKHVVTMVACVCAAVVLAPVGVMAATGQLVNITDPHTSTRKARVGSTGTLQVESRAGSPAGAYTKFFEKLTDVTGKVVVEAAYPKRIAVTEFTATVHGDVTPPNEVRIYYRIRTSGTGSCAAHTGWTLPVTLRTITLSETQQLLFTGPPLLLPKPAAGQAVCLGAQQTTWWNGTKLDIGVSGFTFE